MSSAKKRRDLNRAQQEVEFLKKKVALLESQYLMMKGIAEYLAKKLDNKKESE